MAQQAERGLLGLFVVWLVWLPLPLASNRPWAAALATAAVWVLLALAGLTRLWTRPDSGPGRPHRHRQHWGAGTVLALLVLFAGAVSVQLSPIGYTEDAFETRSYLFRCVGHVGAFGLVLLLVTSDRRRMVLLGGLLAAGVLQAMVAVLLFSAGSRYELMDMEFAQGTRATGTMPNADALANYMVMTLAAGLGVMLTQMGQSRSGKRSTWQTRMADAVAFVMSAKMLVRILLIMMVITLVLTRSRMGNGVFFVGLFLITAWIMVGSAQLRRSAGVLAVSLLVVDLVIIGQWVGLSKVIDRMEATELATQVAASAPADPSAPVVAPTHREESLEERTRPVRDALAMLRERPWAGFGGGSFYNAFTRYKVESAQEPYNHAHNDYVEIAADVGLPGLLLLGGVALLTAMRTIQLMRDSSSPHVRGVAVGVGMGLICALLHALVDLNLQINANAMTLTVLLAVVWSVPTKRATTSPRSR